eukprot:TRINITY_DN961_c0_g1_i1.p1 TRINITY_DN961_c0_g1~~TRINITY_DN961_c0_g1_i1.p1  ORF type:complete len:295 (+),score=124.46 TRINITY_DN961_c0_g1_i1:50-886(+)
MFEILNNLLLNELLLIEQISYGLICFGLITFFILLVIPAPYGRYSKSEGWGPLINAKVAWFLQECPTLIWAMISFFSLEKPLNLAAPNLFILGLFVFHYTNRVLIFPFRIKNGKPTPFSVMFMAFMFCFFNGYIQTRYLCSFWKAPTQNANDYFFQFNFIFGTFLFFFGWIINYHSDLILFNLRVNNQSKKSINSNVDNRYFIPYGGAFNYVSAANLFGEIVEWIGFAIAAWSLPAAAFAFSTFSNLFPRGVQHHKWYLEKFKEKYPKDRKAVIPFIW